jgi:tetratricopeptide (TPR) repeat protein
VSYWDEAGRIYASLLAEKPDDANRMRNVALVHKYMGSLLQVQSKHEEAAARYREALALDERRFAVHPDDRTTQLDVAIDLANAANALLFVPDRAAALEYYERSIAMRERLVASDAKDALARMALGRVYAATALAYQGAAQDDRALDRAERAIEILGPHVATSPDREPKRYLALALFVRGTASDRAGRRDHACADWQQGHAVIGQVDTNAATDPGNYEWIGGLAKLAASCRGGTS